MPAKKILATLQLYGTVPVAADITQGDLYSPGNTTVRTEQLPEVLDMPKPTSSGHTHMCTCVCSLEYVSSGLLCMFLLILRWRRSTCCGSAGQLASQVIGSKSDEAYICSCACLGSDTVENSKSAGRLKETESTSIWRLENSRCRTC